MAMQLYVSQGNGGKATATPAEIVGDSGAIPAATTTALGGVLEGAAVADCTVAADGTSAGTQLNLLLAQLRLAGVIAG